MSFIRKSANGFFYVSRIRTGRRGKHRKGDKVKDYRNWYLVKDNKRVGNIVIGSITFPKEFIGKRIRLKVEYVFKEQKE